MRDLSIVTLYISELRSFRKLPSKSILRAISHWAHCGLESEYLSLETFEKKFNLARCYLLSSMSQDLVHDCVLNSKFKRVPGYDNILKNICVYCTPMLYIFLEAK